MSKTWKWIFGIFLVLVILAVVIGGAFILRNQAMMASNFRRLQLSQAPSSAAPNAQGTPVPGSPNGKTEPYGFGDRRNHMRGWDWGGPMMDGRGPMMGGNGFSGYGGWMPFGFGFFFLGGLLHLIIPLGLLVLVAWIFYGMGKRAGASAAASAPATTPVDPGNLPKGGRKVA